MNNDGLAAYMAQTRVPSNTSMNGETGSEGLLEQVIELLMQGVPPEELIKKGVPIEVVKQAAEYIMQQQGTQQVQEQPVTDAGQQVVASGNGGLAERMVRS